MTDIAERRERSSFYPGGNLHPTVQEDARVVVVVLSNPGRTRLINYL